jgi:hypothetical protein
MAFQAKQILFDALKSTGIELFNNSVNIDPKVKAYVLIKTDLTEFGKSFGDGARLLSASDCDVRVVTSGNFTKKHYDNIQKVKDALKSVDNVQIKTSFSLDYDDVRQVTEYVFALEVTYGES